MTEANWHNCSTAGKRVWCLLELDVATDRKLRLLGVAYGRDSAHLRSDPDSLRRLAVIERYADGHASDAELTEVRGEADDAAARWSAIGPEGVDPFSAEQSRKKAVARAHRAVGQLARVTDRDPPLGVLVGGALWDLWVAGVSAVDDIFGNPFRLVVFHPEWRTETVVALARGCYDDRAWERLPVLADALEDAGCANGDILAHCRGPGPHVRGCWVVDAALGKA